MDRSGSIHSIEQGLPVTFKPQVADETGGPRSIDRMSERQKEFGAVVLRVGDVVRTGFFELEVDERLNELARLDECLHQNLMPLPSRRRRTSPLHRLNDRISH